MKVKFKYDYRVTMLKDGSNIQLAFLKGDEPDLEPQVVAFIEGDAPGVLAGKGNTAKANRMISESETREAPPDGTYDLDSMKVQELKTALRDNDLAVSGNREALIKRLADFLADPTPVVEREF